MLGPFPRPALALAVAGAAALAACSGDLAGPAAPVSAPAFSEGAQAGRFVILASSESLPAELAAQVAAAGGTLDRAFPELGVAFATAADPGFAERAARIAGGGVGHRGPGGAAGPPPRGRGPGGGPRRGRAPGRGRQPGRRRALLRAPVGARRGAGPRGVERRLHRARRAGGHPGRRIVRRPRGPARQRGPGRLALLRSRLRLRTRTWAPSGTAPTSPGSSPRPTTAPAWWGSPPGPPSSASRCCTTTPAASTASSRASTTPPPRASGAAPAPTSST